MMDELRGAVRIAADLTADYLAEVGERPVWQPVKETDRSWLTHQDLPTTGRTFTDLVDDVRARVLPYPMGNGHPRFFGWVNSAPSAAGVLVAPIAAAMNPSCAGGDHSGVLLEHTVLRWLAELVGFPHSPGGGLLTSGASMATVIALAAARQRAGRRDGLDLREEGLYGHPPMVMYVSAEGHSCLRKAAELLGLGNRQVRVVPVDDTFRMDVDVLRRLVTRDKRAGLRPFCVTASAGTVNTGAVDPFDEIADVAADHGMWFHIDGAYGALGVLADNAAASYAGIARADSLVLDPHKWLGVPVDCGCVLWRDSALTRATFSLVPAYLRDENEGGLGWFSEYGPEQTRPFRALRVWATMSHLGRDGVIRLIDTTVQLAHTLAAMINAADDFELLAPVGTSIVAFRYRHASHGERLDELNRQIPAAVQHRGRVFLTGTQLAGAEALRACVLNPATTKDDLVLLLDEIRAATAEIRASEARP